MKFKKVLKLIIIGMFLTGCGADPFAILNDEDYNRKESEFQKYIVTREVKLDELVGTWKVDEKSMKNKLKILGISNVFYETNEEKAYIKETRKCYILIRKDGSVKFNLFYNKEYNGKVFSSNYRKEVYNYIGGYLQDIKGNAFLSISYQEENYSDSITFDCIEVDGVLYIGRMYEIGDIDSGNLEKHHLLYKKVK